MKKVLRLTESDLHRIIKESVKKALNEIGDTEKGQYMLGRLKRKHRDNGELQKMKNVSDYSHEKIKDAFNNYPHYNPNKGHHLSNANYMGWHDKGKENMEECSSTLNEIGDTEKGQFALGAVRGRAQQRAYKEYASDKPNYNKADKYDATARYAGGTSQDEYDKAVQSGRDSQEGLEKGSKLRNAFQRGREYGKSSVKESSK